MKARSIWTLALLTGSLIRSGGQAPSQDRLFEAVLQNNQTLQTAEDNYRAALLEAGTGILPPDPEVELGYLYGKPPEMGNRIDFSVSQKVEFPGAYVVRSRLRKIRSSMAELEYLRTRQEILLGAKILWIQQISLNRMQGLLQKRLRQAEMIHDQFRRQLDAGEVSKLAFSQSALQLAALQGEYDKVLSDIRVNRLSIREMTSGTEVQINDTILPEPVRMVYETLLEQYRENPEYLLYQQELTVKEHQKDLAVNQRLPWMKAGYYSESVLDQQFRGFLMGISLPLWENSNQINLAKAEIGAAASDAARFAYAQEQELLQKLDQFESLKARMELLQEALDSGEGIPLLNRALETGEISLTEYFYASDFHFSTEQQLLQYQKDLLIIEADLLKVYL